MRIVVDLNKCQGYAQCAFLAPDVFTMHGEEALLYDPRAADEHRDAVARAAAACPVQAITVEGLHQGAPAEREQVLTGAPWEPRDGR
ncbi:ferredoxin [Streptomyces sp. NPDC048208]|uniref:ferredoxin n=1 Tax=unclassified Streptomyces TaxID=2593676 RepID=UPI001371B473|nr:ferredoxin [Streptomyces sp. SID4982]MYS15642.1 ferredoxin [Streptomyces sp. SID4982]